MKILILGPGYVGSELAKTLKANGHQVDATARTQEKAKALKEIVDQVLLWNEATPTNFLDPYECLIFTAAATSYTPENYAETYLKNSQKIAQAATTALNLKQIIYTSSTSVYGPGDGETVTEVSPLKGPQVLIDTEKTLLAIPDITVCVLRLGEIIGPGRALEDKLKNQGTKPFPGTGENPVNLSPLNEIVETVQKAIDLKLAGIYNAVSDLHLPRKAVYKAIAKDHNLPEPTWDPSLPTHHSGNRIVSGDKLNNIV
jgi:nucleoside-diphosphate-sugar epimerase